MTVIFSLTAIPPRFEKIQPTLDSLMKQEGLGDFRVLLYIPKSYMRFPDYAGEQPDVPKGVEIRKTEIDYGPATKLLPALIDYADHPDQMIIFCDDDQIYHPDWAKRLVEASRQHPDCAICTRAFDVDQFTGEHIKRESDEKPRAVAAKKALDYKYFIDKLSYKLGLMKETPRRHYFNRAGYIDIAMGVGGVLVKPRFFDDMVFDIPEIARFVDDIWLSAALRANDVKIWTPANVRFNVEVRGDADVSLFHSEFDGKGRKDLNMNCIRYVQENYDIWQPDDA